MLNNCLQAKLSQSVASAGRGLGGGAAPSYFNNRFRDFSKYEVKSLGGRLLFKFLTGTKLPMSGL